MSENTQLLEKLRQYLKHKKSKTYYAEQLGITVEEVEMLLKEIRGTSRELDVEAETANYIADLEEDVVRLASERVNEDGSREISYRSSKPLTKEEIEKLYGIDGISTKLSTYWNKELPSGRYLTSALIKCLKNDFSVDKFQEFLANYKAPPVVKFEYTHTAPLTKEEVDVELSIADFHLDKLTVEPESIEQRVAQYKEAVESLITKTQAAYNIHTIAFILSNDFFHTDSYSSTTTKGTPLDVSTTWNDAYEIGFDLLVWAISYLSVVAKNIEVILVPGNHDRTKSFYLAHALDVYFKNMDNVYFDRTFDTIKYTVLGNTFIGYNHGDGKIDDLPLIFATDRDSSQEFGLAKFREVHTGDKHYYMTKEVKGVRVQQLPSLAGTDRWHKDNGYVNNIRAAIALIYHPKYGKCAEFEYRIP
jgi:hypothetical protein